MRNPTPTERRFLSEDISDFENYCSLHQINNSDFNNKFDGLRIQIDDISAIGAKRTS